MAKLFYSFEESMERYLERNDDGPRRALGEMARFVTAQAKQAALFEKEKLPDLQWAQLQDRFSHGSRAYAAKDMLEHINTNIGHDNAEEWISALSALVSGEPPAAAPES